jgi:hypothetical protein
MENIMPTHNEHPGFYDKWYKIWSDCTPEVLDATAIIRVMECSNGCVQHGYRAESPNALSIEQTRECMKVSMSAIKSKKLPLPTGEVIYMPEGAIPLMDEARVLYQKMKTRDEAAFHEFYALSTAHFHVLGKELIDEKFEFLTEHFGDVFTPYWIAKGKEYIYDALNLT